MNKLAETENETRGSISENVAKHGWVKIHFYAEDIEAIEQKLNQSFETTSELRNALVLNFGGSIRERAKMSDEEKTSRAIGIIAEKFGVTDEKLEQALKLLKLK